MPNPNTMPPSSPRLPSPPPPAEIQLGPQSPSTSLNPTATRASQQMEQNAFTAAAKRRIHPGTKAADMAAGPPLVALNELDSAFQLQEHLSALHHHHTQSNTVPITRETARKLATPPEGIDRTLWLYELCRFLIAQCNSLIVGFLFDTPPCSAATCPEMRASEWQFLCAVHDAPKSCCAIDYCCHTLDWAANVVTNPKIFPSRFVAPVSDSHDKGAALKNLVNVFRRLHRIFAHAWFQHRGVFWSVEGQNGLYVFFKTVCDTYDLLPAENYKLPPEAEGLEMATATTEGKQDVTVTLAQRPVSPPQQGLDPEGFAGSQAARNNTRRHIRSNPSTGNAIPMVPEVDEDDHHAGGAARIGLRGLHSAAAAAAPPAVPEPPSSRSQPPMPKSEPLAEEAEPEAAEVPVIVMEEASPIMPSRRETAMRVTTVETTEQQEQETQPEEKTDEPAVNPKEQEKDLTEAESKDDPAAAAAVVRGPSQPEEPESTPADPEPQSPATEGELDEDAADETIISPTDDEPPSHHALDETKTDDGKLTPDQSDDEGEAAAVESEEKGEEEALKEAEEKDDAAAAAAFVAAVPDSGVKEDLEEAKEKDDAAAAAAVVAAVPEVKEDEMEEGAKEDTAEEPKKDDDAEDVKEPDAKEDVKEPDAKEDVKGKDVQDKEETG